MLTEIQKLELCGLYVFSLLNLNREVEVEDYCPLCEWKIILWWRVIICHLNRWLVHPTIMAVIGMSKRFKRRQVREIVRLSTFFVENWLKNKPLFHFFTFLSVLSRLKIQAWMRHPEIAERLTNTNRHEVEVVRWKICVTKPSKVASLLTTLFLFIFY